MLHQPLQQIQMLSTLTWRIDSVRRTHPSEWLSTFSTAIEVEMSNAGTNGCYGPYSISYCARAVICGTVIERILLIKCQPPAAIRTICA
jgi:hypothetical protein